MMKIKDADYKADVDSELKDAFVTGNLSFDKITSLVENRSVKVLIYNSIDSTNDETKRIIKGQAPSESFLVVSEEQTKGRGRNNKSFFSPSGVGLYMTFAIKCKLSNAIGITSYAAVCVVDAISELTGIKCGIKWVNDIFLDGKKIAGILAEAVFSSEKEVPNYVIVGIGVNINQTSVPDELRDIIGYLNLDKDIKNELAALIVNKLSHYDIADKSYIPKYREYSVVLGRAVRYKKDNCIYNARAVDINDDGALIVLREDGKEDILNSAEISLRID